MRRDLTVEEIEALRIDATLTFSIPSGTELFKIQLVSLQMPENEREGYFDPDEDAPPCQDGDG